MTVPGPYDPPPQGAPGPYVGSPYGAPPYGVPQPPWAWPLVALAVLGIFVGIDALLRRH